MSEHSAIEFQQPGLLAILETLDDAALDGLKFGVIGFDRESVVRRYNRYESQASGLEQSRVLGHDVFTVVAQCMNNFLVAQQYEEAIAGGTSLDQTIDYVLTWRMRPTKVKLRMLSSPEAALQYVALLRF